MCPHNVEKANKLLNLLISHVLGTPGREQNFNDRAQQLQQFSTRAAKTARMVAAGGSSGNKKLAEALLSSASQVCL
jgi:UDP-N-acetylglucosamine:LPS N-acetylglucosamine transferase